MDVNRAFTLVELMVAISLSLLIAATATSAFQVASKALTQSERLSKENQLVRAAYQAGTEEADFWYAADDPFDPAGHSQRSLNGGTGVGANGNPFVALDLPPEYHNWNVSDPRTWQLLGMRRDGSGGDFSILSTVDSSGAEPAVTDWYPTMLDTVFHTLGVSASFEYFPPNAGYTWYLDGDRNAFGEVLPGARYALAHGNWPHKMNTAYRITNNTMGERDAINNGRARALHGMKAVIAPRAGWMLGTTERHDLASRMTLDHTNGGLNGGKPQPDWNTIKQDLTATVPFFEVKPEEWPGVDMAVARMDTNYGREVAIDIKMVNPISGDIRLFSFHTVGTTLRGARMQRDWSHFGGDPSPANRMEQ